MPDMPASDPSESSAPLTLAPDTLPELLALSPDALVVVDQAGTITHVNREAQALFGYRAAELVRHPLETLLPSRFRTRHLVQRERYVAAPHARPMGANLDLSGQIGRASWRERV